MEAEKARKAKASVGLSRERSCGRGHLPWPGAWLVRSNGPRRSWTQAREAMTAVNIQHPESSEDLPTPLPSPEPLQGQPLLPCGEGHGRPRAPEESMESLGARGSGWGSVRAPLSALQRSCAARGPLVVLHRAGGSPRTAPTRLRVSQVAAGETARARVQDGSRGGSGRAKPWPSIIWGWGVG